MSSRPHSFPLALALSAFTTITACSNNQEAASKAQAKASCCASSNASAVLGSAAPAASASAHAPETAATSAKVGKTAPDFKLATADGKTVSLADLKGKTVVLEWFNPGCPFVKQAHEMGSLKTLAKDVVAKFGDLDVVWVAINSGAPGKQGHGAEANLAAAKAWGLDHAIALDEDGKVGRAYGATNTPHLYVIDKTGVLRYAGALDNTRSGDPEDAPDSGLVNHVLDALTALQSGKAVNPAQTKAWGCTVKYGS